MVRRTEGSSISNKHWMYMDVSFFREQNCELPPTKMHQLSLMATELFAPFLDRIIPPDKDTT